MLKFFGRDNDMDGGAIVSGPTYPFADEGTVIEPSKPKSRWSKLFNVKAVGGLITASAQELGRTGAAIVNPNSWAKDSEDYDVNSARRRNAAKMAATSVATFAAKTAFLSGAAAVGIGAAGSIAIAAGAASAASATVKLATRFTKNAWRRYTSEDTENRPPLMSKDDWKAVGKSALFGSVGGLIGGSIHELMGSPSFDDLKNMLGFAKVNAETVAQAAAVAPAAKVAASAAAPVEVPVVDPHAAVVTTETPVAPSAAPAHDVTPAHAAPAPEAPRLGVTETQQLKDEALQLYRSGGTQEDVVRAIEMYEQAAQGTGPGAIQAANDLQYLKNIGVYDTAMQNPVSPSSLHPTSTADTTTTTGTGDTTSGEAAGAPRVAAPVEAAPVTRPNLAARCTATFDRIAGFLKPRMGLTCDVSPSTPVLSGEAVSIATNGVDGATPYAQDAINGGADTTLGDFIPVIANPFRDRVAGMAAPSAN
ncbi:MAG: hypothetical protein AB7E85_08295 [Pseudobdellovibrionaceae bacterium]